MKKYLSYFFFLSAFLFLGACTKTDLTVNTPSNSIKTPANFKGVAFSANRIDLTWTDSSNNEEGFKILRKNGTLDYVIIANLAANSTNYADTGLSADETYSYKIYAFNANNSSVNSNAIEVTTLPGIPNAPSNLKATVYDATQIDISWSDLSGNEQGFKIERKTGNGAFAVIGVVARNETKFSDIGLVIGTTYTYRVTAYNTLGNSNYTNQVDAKPILTPNLSPTTNNLNKIHFITDDIGFIAGDNIVLKTTNGGKNWSVIKETTGMDFTAIRFENNLTGYLGGNDQYYAYIYKTTDGGITWAELSKTWYGNDRPIVNDIACFNNDYAYIVNAYSGGRYYGGLYIKNASKLSADRGDQGFNCMEYNNGKLLIGGTVYWNGTGYYAGTQLVTNFNTPQLIPATIGLVESIYGISMFSNKALAVGANSSISLSSDNGLNWTSRTLAGYSSANFNATTLQDANKGFIVGDGGLVLTTTDGGLNWNKMDNANKENLVSMSKKPNNGIYAVGKKGVIMKIQ
jgi:photosystem II stability/assembly factor-like uncharacterized protein